MAMETTAFRLDEVMLKLLGRLAEIYEISRSRVVRQSVTTLAALQNAAADDSYDTVTALAERYGDDAEIVIGVREGADGIPEGRVLVNGESVDDVRVIPAVSLGTEWCFLFLEVEGTPKRDPVFVTTSDDEAMMLRHARLSAGRLPWPPDPDNRLGLVMRLKEMPSEMSAELQQLAVGNGHAR